MHTTRRIFQAIVFGLITAAIVFSITLKSSYGGPCSSLFEARWQVVYYEYLSPTKGHFSNPELDPQYRAYARNIGLIQSATPDAKRRFLLIKLGAAFAGLIAAIGFGYLAIYRDSSVSNKTYVTGARLATASEVKSLVRKGEGK